MRIRIGDALLTEETSKKLKRDIEFVLQKKVSWDEVYNYLYYNRAIKIGSLEGKMENVCSQEEMSLNIAKQPIYCIMFFSPISEEWHPFYTLTPNEKGIVFTVGEI